MERDEWSESIYQARDWLYLPKDMEKPGRLKTQLGPMCNWFRNLISWSRWTLIQGEKWAWQRPVFLFRNSGWICRKQNGQQAWWGQGDREGQGATAASGSRTPSCSPVPSQPQPELERSYLSFPGHTEASKGHCAVGLWLLESYSALYPSARHMGSGGALSCPVLSPRAWASPPGYVPGKRIWMESWSLLPKSCPFKQSQAFWNYPHLLLSSMLVITRLRFVGVAEPIQPNSGLSWRCVLVKLRKSSEFNLWR